MATWAIGDDRTTFALALRPARPRRVLAQGLRQCGTRVAADVIGHERSRLTDGLKERIERWAGDEFIAWYNAQHGTQFQFVNHAAPPRADLVYFDGSVELPIEITGTFYGQDGAKFEGMNARGLPDAPDGWSSLKADGSVVSIDDAFLGFLERRLLEKSRKSYAAAPILVIYHVSRLLSSDGISRMIQRVSLPADHPFTGIYLLADLPNGDPEGDVCIRQLGSDP